jgi:stage V sporulation protein B
MIQGMVFPVIAFPSAFFYALAELIVPELTEAQVNGRLHDISQIVSRILYFCLLFSLGVTAVMFSFSGALGLTLYKSTSVGYYIRLLALLMPVIFMDSVTDGMLRGLGQQMYSMAYNIIDSAISVVLVWFLLPKYAVAGYIIMIYFTDIFNFSLSIRRLRKITKFRLDFKNILKAVISAAGAVNIAALLLRLLGLPLLPGGLVLTVHIALSLFIYVLLLLLLRCFGRKDLNWLRSVMRPQTAHAEE